MLSNHISLDVEYVSGFWFDFVFEKLGKVYLANKAQSLRVLSFGIWKSDLFGDLSHLRLMKFSDGKERCA